MKTMGQMRDGGRPRRDIKENEILPRSWMSPMINVRFLIPIFIDLCYLNIQPHKYTDY